MEAGGLAPGPPAQVLLPGRRPGRCRGIHCRASANFGIDPEDDERNVVQLRVEDVECLGAAWLGGRLRCQMQPIPVGGTTLRGRCSEHSGAL